MDIETEMKLHHKFLLKCRKCGHKFLPWHSFGINNAITGWKDGFVCPCCGNLATKDEYDKAD